MRLLLRLRTGLAYKGLALSSIAIPSGASVRSQSSMKNLLNILVGIDFSTPSENALREAARIARWDHAKLTALHVLDEDVVKDLRRHAPELKEDFTAEGKGHLDTYVEGVLGHGHGVECQFAIGNPLRVMTKAVKDYSADLLVLGSHGRDSVDPHQVGHLASRCTRKVAANVLLVRERQFSPFCKVVACIDFSENAAKAAVQAVHIAQQDKALLEFLHVCEPIPEVTSKVDYLTSLAAQIMGSDYQKRNWERLQDSLARFVEPIVSECGGHQFTTKVLIRPRFRQAIVDHLNETKADLVVLGTRGRTSIHNLLLGSTAERIIHHASCSILAIKPDGFDYELD